MVTLGSKLNLIMRLANAFLCVFILNITTICLAQIPESTGHLVDFLNDKLEAIPGDGTDIYADPTDSDFQVFTSAIELVADHRFEEANTSLQTVGYQLLKFTDQNSSRVYYVVEEPGESQSKIFGGTYVYCYSCTREKVVIQAPHSLKDADTGEQAILLFYNLQNKWLMNNGAHRCNSLTGSSCDGTTSVCLGVSSPYPISDGAHNDKSLFQAATIGVDSYYTENNKELFIIQLHGFNKDSRPSDFPDIVASYGTRDQPPVGRSESVALKTRIESLCNCSFGEYHIDTDIDQLGGTTNTQGRYLNQSPDPCDENGTINSGKFYHFEQSRFIRDNQSFLLQALEDISEPLTPVLASDDQHGLVKVYPNPVSDLLTIEFGDFNTERTFDLIGLSGEVIFSQLKASTESQPVSFSELSTGIYFLKIFQKGELYFETKILKE